MSAVPGRRYSSIHRNASSIGSRRSSAKSRMPIIRRTSPAAANPTKWCSGMPDIPARALTVGPVAKKVTLRDQRLRVTLGDVVLFEGEPITPIAGRHRVGVSTFGPGTAFERLELHKLAKKR